ncbi:MAG: septum formation family protein [Salinibacterium amurskyense]
MTSGDNSSGAGNGNEPRQSSFNWGLTPSDPEAPPATPPKKPLEPTEPEESTRVPPRQPDEAAAPASPTVPLSPATPPVMPPAAAAPPVPPVAPAPPVPPAAAAPPVPPAAPPAPVVPGATALEVPLPPLTPAPATPPAAPPSASPEIPGLLKLPPVAGEVPPVSQPASPPAPLVEPPATEAMNVAELPTSAMNLSDLPTGAMDVADLPTGAMDISDLPTGAMDVADLPTAAMAAPTRRQSHMPPAVDPALDGATEVMNAQSLAGISAEAESVEHDAVGDLFGEDKFVEYDDQVLAAPSSAVVVRQRVPPPPRPPIPRGQMIALAVGGGLVAALALVALFLLGTRIGENAEPAVAVSATPTAVPTETIPVVGPVAPGTYQWDELAGGECLEPFASAWEQEYTVIECAQPHAAQLLTVGQFDDAASDPYPDAEELASRTAQACSTDSVIDFAAATSFADLEIVASFAATADDWDAGNRDYYCFATRAGDDALTASVAQPQTPES